MMLMLVHTPEITNQFQSTELAGMLQQVTITELTLMRFIMIPYAALCATAAICAPFFFQTEIPISVEIGMAMAIGWLFTYVIRKDYNPAWYTHTQELISAIIVERLATALLAPEVQTLLESAQSSQEE
jgi:flagellar biosynthesis protein FliR